jgi:hypothetical protein
MRYVVLLLGLLSYEFDAPFAFHLARDSDHAVHFQLHENPIEFSKAEVFLAIPNLSQELIISQRAFAAYDVQNGKLKGLRPPDSVQSYASYTLQATGVGAAALSLLSLFENF